MIIFTLFLTLYPNKIEVMSFAQRLSKVQRKASEGNEVSPILKNQVQKLNLKNSRKLTDFQQHHSDLKNMLTFLESGKSAQLSPTPQKNKNKGLGIRPETKTIADSIDTKQNTGSKMIFKESPDKKYKLKITSQRDQSNIFEIEKGSILLQNLKCGNKQIKQNPENPPLISHKSVSIPAYSGNKEKKGIPNIGNTCYINAVLQCLFHTKDFNEGFIPTASNKTQILNKYLALYQGVMSKTSQKVDLSTLSLKKSVSKICSLFIDFHQQDAHQFLKELLESIHQQINRVKTKDAYRVLESNTSKKNLSILAHQYWSYYKKFDDSYIYDCLSGQICNYITCANCKFQAVSFENFLELSLPMIKGRNRLEDLLKEYFDVEALSDFYYCSSCKKSSKKSLKRSELWRNPNYLIVQLKRSQFGRKNSERIRIPVKCLNLKPYFTEVEKQSRSTMYHLQGVVLHRGVIQGGHYWANIKDGLNWYSVDDQKVEKLDRQEFLKQYELQGSQEAYILFYKCI